MVQQLQEYREQNCILLQEKALAEQNNCKVISEVKEYLIVYEKKKDTNQNYILF